MFPRITPIPRIIPKDPPAYISQVLLGFQGYTTTSGPLSPHRESRQWGAMVNYVEVG